MKILFVRHGESVDDLEDRYGGWADYDLTEKGRKQVIECAERISSFDEKFEIILSSPLKRASQAADIFSNKLNLDIEIFEYFKERNLNGILTGLVRSEAKEKYPELVRTHANYQYVDGSERDEDFNIRVRNAAKILFDMKYNSLIAVTHGLFLKVFLKEVVGVDIKRVGNGGFVLIEKDGDNFKILKMDAIET